MSISPAQSLPKLYGKHRAAIDILKNLTENHFPDLKKNSTLNDGTKVDDLFYLRYILSSKKPLETSDQIRSSETFEHVLEACKFRNSDNHQKMITSSKEASLLRTIPMIKTGELKNGYPVLFLPVKDVNFDLIAKHKNDQKFRNNLLDLLLFEKSQLFEEMDRQSRSSGELIKSVVVYDMNGMSFSSVYKLKDFFDLMHHNKKLFKALYPQSTSLTAIVNSPGGFLLKSLITSSKQKVMTAKQFIKNFEARDAVPDLIGGAVVWPKTADEMMAFVNGSCSVNKEPEVKKVEIVPVSSDLSSDSLIEGFNVAINTKSSKKKGNKKIVLTALEREMVHMKKNKLFSIDVLEKDQKVNLFFSNLRKKNANILIVIKEQNGTFKNTAVIPSGFGTLSLKLKTKGEVMLVYLDGPKAEKFGQASDIETMKLKNGLAKKALKFGKKTFNRGYHSDSYAANMNMKKLRKQNKLSDMMNLETAKRINERNQIAAMNLADSNKVLFRFEVSDNVVCGNELTVTDKQIAEMAQLPSAPSEDVIMQTTTNQDLVDFEAQSLMSMDSEELKASENISFFGTAARVLTRGW